MSSLVSVDFSKIEGVLLHGDLSKLSTPEKVNYYNRVCESLGLNPLTKPFDYIKLNGKEVLYAKRDATDQLRKIHAVSINGLSKEVTNDILLVTAKAVDKSGREDEAVGAVNIKGLVGEALANAYMKAETKAKRRVTLSICGLGLLDEVELEGDQSVEARDVRAKELTARVQQAGDLEVESAPAFEASDYFNAPEPQLGGLGDYEIQIGRKYKGKKLKDIAEADLANYSQWLAEQDSQHPSVLSCVDKIKKYLEGT